MKKFFLGIILGLFVGLGGFYFFQQFQKNIQDIPSKEPVSNSGDTITVENPLGELSQKISDDYISPKQKGDKKTSPEVTQAFKNIDAYQNKDEVYSYRLAFSLFPAIGIQNCEELSQTLGIKYGDIFQKECHIYNGYIAYLNGDSSKLVVGDMLSDELKSQTCNNTFLCAAVSGTERSTFEKDALEFIKGSDEEKNKIISNIEPSSYTFLSFKKDISPLSDKEHIDTLYDNALIFSALSKKQKTTCEGILDEDIKKFCFDVLSGENKKYYEDIFYDFFSELYIRNISI